MPAMTHPMLAWADRHRKTVQAVAIAAGCSEWHLRNILAGRKEASLGLAKRLSDVSNSEVPLDAFLRPRKPKLKERRA